MADRQLPDAALLRKLLRYDAETGKLFWLPRTPDLFDDDCADRRIECTRWNSRYAGREAFTTYHDGYFTGGIKFGGKQLCLRAHRVIWCMTYGDWPEQIDHIDQDRGNNRLHNLRLATREQNARNCGLSRRNRSGRIGVNWKASEGIWRAKIRHGGRYIELGRFTHFADAVKAREDAERLYGYSEIHGKKRKP